MHLHDRRTAGHTDIGSSQHRQSITWVDELTLAKLGFADYSDPAYLDCLKDADVEMGNGKVITKLSTEEKKARRERKRKHAQKKRRGSLQTLGSMGGSSSSPNLYGMGGSSPSSEGAARPTQAHRQSGPTTPAPPPPPPPAESPASNTRAQQQQRSEEEARRRRAQEALQCPVCLGTPGGEWHQCNRGHAICAGCDQNLSGRSCVVCRATMPPYRRAIRCLAHEQAIENARADGSLSPPESPRPAPAPAPAPAQSRVPTVAQTINLQSSPESASPAATAAAPAANPVQSSSEETSSEEDLDAAAAWLVDHQGTDSVRSSSAANAAASSAANAASSSSALPASEDICWTEGMEAVAALQRGEP
eukprot:CAMPEP_0196685870 /NCGR_PEP_ID=MMETSP1090-20130531/11499_1 /TAXON_ID=37098 /ORGANISM="Isochrysis sp, Strain CCMP1244" /LENGTH=361 /DNA_ID=CAMNT_0042024419 /DNA_START=90 /DNA_END=1172 /DNA_ORIENTATION=-